MNNKKKKLLSLLAALSIAATAFTGLAIPVSADNVLQDTNVTLMDAETTTAPEAEATTAPEAEATTAPSTTETSVASYDFEGTLDSSWTASKNQYTITQADDTTLNSKVLYATASGTGGRTGTTKLPTAVSPTGTNPVRVEFKWNSQTTVGSCTTDTVLVDSSSNQIFKINKTTAGAITIVKPDGTTDSVSTGDWVTVSATLDFETHRIINISFTKVGGTTTETFYDIPFISSAASDVGGFYLVGNRASGATLTSNVYFDDIALYNVTSGYYKVTMNVKDSSNNAVSDATVTLNGVTYTTDSDGKIETKLAAGSYAYTVKKAGYEATTGQEDDAAGTITVSDAAVTENVTYSPQTYTPVPGTVTMSGGQKAMTAPHTNDTVTSSAFSVAVLDQKGVEITDADVAWTILPTDSETADSYVTISNGVITVAKGFTAGDTHVKNFTVTANVSKNGTNKSATASVAISDYLFYEPGVGGSSYGTTNTAMLNTGGTNSGTDSYIATPATKGTTETITFPETITFTPGTAQLLSFKTTVQNKVAYTFQREVNIVASDGTEILSLGYINLDIGDSSTADWNTSTSTFATTWGSISALNAWTDVSLLFKTTADGTTKVKLTVAGNEYDMGTTTATNISSIQTYLGLNTVDRYALLKDIVVESVDVTGVEIAGKDAFSTIDNTVVSQNYSIDAMVLEDGETFTWSVTDESGAAIDGVTITPSNDTLSAQVTVNGILDKSIVLNAVSSVSTDEKPKKAAKTVTVAPAVVKSATIDGSKTLDKTAGTSAYSVADVTDQYGDDITDYVSPKWSLAGETSEDAVASFKVTAEEAGSAVAITATYDEAGKLTNITEKDVTLTVGENTIDITAPSGAKVMLWDSVEGMKPLADAVTAKTEETEITNASIDSDTGLMTITDEGDVNVKAVFTNNGVEYPFEKAVKIDTFSVVADATEDSTEVDISALVEDDAITGYLVTTAADGVEVKSTTVDKDDVENNKITADTTGAKKVEIVPVFETAMSKEVLVPADRYNVTVTANNGSRTDVYANDQLIINNLNQGSDTWTVARTIPASADYNANDVVISGGSVQFNYQDDKSSASTVTNVKLTKAPSIVDRAKRIYVIGDSLVAKYYGDAPEGSEGLVRTGWGDVLGNFIKDGVEVTNLGNSGAWAEGMLADAFTNVRQSAQSGDIFILESGYNDSSHTSMDVMKASVKTMVNEAEAIGMKVFVVTPNSSSHSGNEYIGSVKSTSSMIEAVNELQAAGSKAVLINLAAKSADYYRSYYGDATYSGDTPSVPSETTTLLQTYYNNSGDALHSSYNAASCWAAIIANGLLNDTDTKAVVNTNYAYSFSDGTNNISVSANQIVNPDYKTYGITNTADDVTVTRPNGIALTAAGSGETVKIVAADSSKTISVAKTDGTAVDITYNDTTKAYYFTMPAEAVTITAATMYAITAADGSASVTFKDANGNAITSAAAGDTVTIVPGDGVTLSGVTVTGTSGTVETTAGNDGTYTFTMPAEAVTITATAVTTYTITTTEVTGATVTTDLTHAAAGATVTVTVTADTGYTVSSVTASTTSGTAVEVTGSGSTYTFTMPAEAVTVTAVVTKTMYAITAAGDTDSVKFKDADENAITSAAAGDTVTIVLTDSGELTFSAVTAVTASGNSVTVELDVNSRYATFTMPAEAVTVTVTVNGQ